MFINQREYITVMGFSPAIVAVPLALWILEIFIFIFETIVFKIYSGVVTRIKDIKKRLFMSVVELKNICKKFGDKEIFKNFNLTVEEGDFVSIMGVSGSGKSTLLNIIGMLEKAYSGDIEILGIKNPKFNSGNGIKLLRNGVSVSVNPSTPT